MKRMTRTGSSAELTILKEVMGRGVLLSRTREVLLAEVGDRLAGFGVDDDVESGGLRWRRDGGQGLGAGREQGRQQGER